MVQSPGVSIFVMIDNFVHITTGSPHDDAIFQAIHAKQVSASSEQTFWMAIDQSMSMCINLQMDVSCVSKTPKNSVLQRAAGHIRDRRLSISRRRCESSSQSGGKIAETSSIFCTKNAVVRFGIIEVSLHPSLMDIDHTLAK